jgi:hypothetical protein
MHISSGQPAKTIIEHFNTEAASCRPAADPDSAVKIEGAAETRARAEALRARVATPCLEMVDGMDLVDDVDTEKIHLRGGGVHSVHNVHSVHCLNKSNWFQFARGSPEAASCRPAADLRARAEARFKQNGISLMRLSNRAQARLGLH